MLEWLRIWNFQKHEYLELDLSHDVVCLTGASDQGKSSAIRALVWLLTNRPSGLGFLRRGATEVKVSLGVDGHEITRIKSKGTNVYILDGSPYEAFGTGVPEDIKSVINAADLSLQTQLAPPYLFTSPPGDVARELNAVVSLDLIDNTLAGVASEYRKAKTTVEVVQERLQSARLRRKALSWVKQAQQRFTEIEALASEINRLAGEIERLDLLRSEIAQINAQITRLGKEIQQFESLIGIASQAASLLREIKQLDELLEQGAAFQQKLAEREAEIKILEVELAKELDGKCPLCGSESYLW